MDSVENDCRVREFSQKSKWKVLKMTVGLENSVRSPNGKC